MNQRRVRPLGRPVYGRGEPLMRPTRRAPRNPGLRLWQKRLMLLVVLVVAAIWGLLKLFAISKLTVVAPSRGDEIRTEVEKITTQGSWSQGNLLTLDEGQLVSNLQLADPMVRSADVKRQWPHGLQVSVLLKRPSMGWSSGNQRYLLDSDGTAIGVLPAGSALPVVNDGSNLPVQSGKQVVSARFVAFVTALVPALAQQHIGVRGLDIKDTTFDLTVTTDKGYNLMFDTSRSVGDELADLRSVQALLASQKKAPAEYIDLRIAGKAYWK